MRYRRARYGYALVLSRNEPVGADRPTVAPTCWRPAADVYETPKSLIVTVELAGVSSESIDLVLFDDALVAEGVRGLPTAPSGLYHTAQIRQGGFRLELPLPRRIDSQHVQARLDQGLLVISLPKADQS